MTSNEHLELIQLRQALSSIESLVSDDFSSDIDYKLHKGRLRKHNKEDALRLMKIYRIAHSFNKAHSCYSVHTDWRGEVLQNQSL